MDDLQDLYQEVIIDHARRPRNFGPLEDANRRAEGYNPLCGDRVRVSLRVEDGVVRELRFEGSGCAISTASASVMTEAVRGRPLEEVQALFRSFHSMVTGCPDFSSREPDGLAKLKVFSGVVQFPARVKCATLCWHTLQGALDGQGEAACTE